MAIPKRPLGLAAAHLAKKQKTQSDGVASDERKVVSTGSALRDLREMLQTALKTRETSWYRATIHEGDRLLRLDKSHLDLEPDDDDADRLANADERRQVRHDLGRALLGLGVLLSNDADEKPMPGEPENLDEWLDAAQAHLPERRCEIEASASASWLSGLILAHRVRQNGSNGLPDAIRDLARVGSLDRPTDTFDTVLLVMAICEEDTTRPGASEALAWTESVLRDLGPEFSLHLANSLLLVAAKIAEDVEEEAGSVASDEWALPTSTEVQDGRQAAEEAASIFATCLEKEKFDQAGEDELKVKVRMQRERTKHNVISVQLGEALILQANLTADETEREELYTRAERHAGVIIDVNGGNEIG